MIKVKEKKSERAEEYRINLIYLKLRSRIINKIDECTKEQKKSILDLVSYSYYIASVKDKYGGDKNLY